MIVRAAEPPHPCACPGHRGPPRRRRVPLRGHVRQVGGAGLRHQPPRVHRRVEGHVGPARRHAALVATRKDEQRAAADALGSTGEVVFLGEVDGELEATLARRSEVAYWIRGCGPTSCSATTRGSATACTPTIAHAGFLACDGIVGARDPHFFPEHACPTIARRRCCCSRPTSPTTSRTSPATRTRSSTRCSRTRASSSRRCTSPTVIDHSAMHSLTASSTSSPRPDGLIGVDHAESFPPHRRAVTSPLPASPRSSARARPVDHLGCCAPLRRPR